MNKLQARTTEKEKGVDVQRYTIEDKKGNKLPEAAYTILDQYYENLPDAPKQSESYYRYIKFTFIIVFCMKFVL